MNFKVFKSKPVLWIVGGIFLFIIFYMLMNRGGSEASSGGITTVNTGPSDAAIAASTQLQMAQIQTGAAVQQSQQESAAAIAIATLQAQGQIADIQAGADTAKYLASQEANTQMRYLDIQKDIAQTNAEYSYDTAVVASETALGLQHSQQEMFSKQLDTNLAMLDVQSQNLIQQSLISQIPSLKKKNRDDVLIALANNNRAAA